MKLVFEMEKRVVTESQASTITEIHGTILGTERLSFLPSDKIGSVLAAAIKHIPLCTRLVLEVGKPVQFSRIESVIQKEFPSEGSYHIDQLQHTAGLFGTFFCSEHS